MAAAVPDIVWHVHGRPKGHPSIGVHKGPQGVQKFFGIIADTQTATDFSPRDFYISGDKVFVLGHYAWTLRKTGKKVAMEWVHMFTIKGGKVAQFDEFTDTVRLARLIGGPAS